MSADQTLSPEEPVGQAPPSRLLSRMTVKRWVLSSIPLALFTGLCGILLVGLQYDPHDLPSVLIDKPLPAFTLPPLKSDKPGLEATALGGKPVLINFFASWCQPCRLEQPVLNRIAAKGGIPIYGITYKDEPQNSKAYLAQLGDPYQRIGVDFEGHAAIDFGLTGVPETFLVDGKGVIRYHFSGPISERVLQDEILPRLKQIETAQN